MAVEVDLTKTERFNLPLAVGRLNPRPVDGSYVWATMADAQSYAASNPTAYVGQLLYVKETNKVYKIENTAGTLKEIGSGVESLKPFMSITQLADYLFEVQYPRAGIDYDYARDYFEHATVDDFMLSGCTGIFKDKQVFRNLDWYYGDLAEFIIHVPADPEKQLYASVGISSGTKGLTRAVVESGVANEKYKLAPFTMTDGINAAGLYMQSNVVPKNGIEYDINPTKTEILYIPELIRDLLDHCGSIIEVDQRLNNIHIKSTAALTFGYHLMVAQGTQWAIYEFTANSWTKTTSMDMPYGIISNFRTTGLNIDPVTGEIDWNSVEQYGIGVERYERALKAFDTVSPKSFIQLQDDLKYSNFYSTTTNPLWLTELAGENDPLVPGRKLTVMDAKTSPAKFATLLTAEREKWAEKTRADGKGTWHTVHNAIYDLEHKSFDIYVQERFDQKFSAYINGESSVEAAKQYAQAAAASKVAAQNAQIAAQNAEANASSYATQAGNNAIRAEAAATRAENALTLCTMAEYNALPRPLSATAKFLITDL